MRYKNFASAVAMSLGVLATPLTFADLVAYYPFNGNANDESSNGFDGTVVGATLTQDRFGNANSAYFFDGQDDYIRIDSGPNLLGASQTTLVAWVKSYPNKGEDCSRVLEIGTHFSNSTALVLDSTTSTCTAGGVRAWVHADGQRQGEVKSQGDGINYNDDTWHFLAFTYDGSTTKLYVDGILKRNRLANGIIDSVSKALIGAHSFPSPIDGYFGGIIDDVGVYDHALSECEIQSLYTGKPECACVLSFEDVTHPFEVGPFFSCYQQKYSTQEACEAASGTSVHIPFPIPDGQNVTVTSGQWYEMNCKELQKEGIIPTWVKLLATGVELEAFQSEGQVDLTLTTSSENGTAQLLILRGEKLENGGTLVKTVCQFNSGGSPYSCTDDTVGDTYRAAEIEYDGDLIVYEEVKPKKANKK